MPTTWDALGIDIRESTHGQTSTTCPRCSESRHKKHVRCLSVNLDEGVWQCHHCAWSGSLAQGEDRRSSAPVRRYRLPAPVMPATAQASVDTWMAHRGIPAAIVARHHITSARVYMPQDEDEMTVIAFPYFRNGQHINTKYRDTHKHFRMDTGCELLLYGLDDVCGDTVTICEGEMDLLALETAGVTSIVSVPNGAPAPDAKQFASHFDYLASADDVLKPLQKILIAVDTDAPGHKLAEELARRLGQERCWRVSWPTDCASVHQGWSDTSKPCKDANDVLLHHGAARVAQCWAEARPWPVSGIITVDMLTDAIEALYTQGSTPGVSPGWLALAERYTVKTGEMTVITGVPSHGKSRLLSNMLVNIAQHAGWRFVVFSPESKRMERLARLMIEQYTQRSFQPGPYHLDEFDLWEAQAWLGEHCSFLFPHDAKPTVQYLLNLTRIEIQRKGIKGLVLDPWNWIEHGRPPRQSETDYVGEVLTEISLFAANHDIHVWIVVHPTKLKKDQKGEYAGKFPPATLYDCHGSVHFYNKADNGLCVWRDTETGSLRTQVHILKVRFEEVGSAGGFVELVYNPATKTYSDPDVMY